MDIEKFFINGCHSETIEDAKIGTSLYLDSSQNNKINTMVAIVNSKNPARSKRLRSRIMRACISDVALIDVCKKLGFLPEEIDKVMLQ